MNGPKRNDAEEQIEVGELRLDLAEVHLRWTCSKGFETRNLISHFHGNAI